MRKFFTSLTAIFFVMIAVAQTNYYVSSSGNNVTGTGTSGNPWKTIQFAINNAAVVNGDIINVAAGNYYENVLVNKEVKIIGPKAGVDGNDASRGTGEAIIYPTETNLGDGTYNGGKIFIIHANNVTIDGLTLNGDNPSLTGYGYEVNGTGFDAAFGLSNYDELGTGGVLDQPFDNLIVKNNVIKNFWLGGFYFENGTTTGAKYAEVTHNKVENVPVGIGIHLYQNHYAHIEYNTVINCKQGIALYFYYNPPPTGKYGTIKYNTVLSKTLEINWGDPVTNVIGIAPYFVYNDLKNVWYVSDNNVTNTTPRSSGSRGYSFVLNMSPLGLVIENNNATGYESGYVLNLSSNIYDFSENLKIKGGVVSNCSFGVNVTNLSEYYGNALTGIYNVEQLTINNNTVAGVYVDDESPLNLYPTNVTANVTNCKINNNPIGVTLHGLNAFASVHDNDLSGNSSFAINNLSPNTVNATCSWYGHWTGPTISTNIGGQGSKVSSNVTYDPWLVNGTDADPSLAGFQPVAGSCVPIKCGTQNKKYLVCHNGHTLCVGYDDALIHLGHGDPLGACSPTLITNNNIIPEEIINEFKVSAFPNPFSNTATIKYQLPVDGQVSINIYDVSGRKVTSLINTEKKAGLYSFVFDASKFDKGVYYYKLTVITKEKEFSQSGKLLKQ